MLFLKWVTVLLFDHTLMNFKNFSWSCPVKYLQWRSCECYYL